MSRGFIKEGDQEEIPMVPPRAHLPKGMPNHVTHEGLDALLKERQYLENQRAEAGDNYILCNFIDAKLKLLVDRINSAVEVDLTKANKDVVSFGAWVKYNDRTVRIVGVDEADLQKGLLSFISPIAKALIGKKVGDVFEIVVPKGKETINVQEISFEPMNTKGERLLGERGKGEKVKGERVKGPQTRNVPQIPETLETFETLETLETLETSETPETPETPLFVPDEKIMDFLPLVNDRGIIVGRALYLDLHKGNKILHPSIHLHVSNGDRTEKYWWHVAFGETPEKTIKRKLQETLGLSNVNPKLKKQYIRVTKLEKELVYVFKMTTEADILKTPQTKEYLEIFSKD